MPMSYVRHDDRHLVVVTIEGTFDPSEIVEVMRRLDEDDIWTHGVLWDLRQMSGQPTTDDLWFFSRAYVHAPERPQRARGPVAIVTADNDMYRTGCLYVAMSQPRLDADVFRDVDDARTWLDGRIAASSSV